MSTKFDDPSYLAAWVNGGKYPDIHSNITFAAGMHMRGGRVLDLCCSYGLLGARLKEKYPEKFPYAIGLDADEKVLNAALAAKLPLDYLGYWRLVPDTANDFLKLLQLHAIDCIVARRAFPELFSDEMGSGHSFGRAMAHEFHAMGIREILLEGRVYSPRSSNSLSKLQNEVELFSEYYDAEYLPLPNIALLRAK